MTDLVDIAIFEILINNMRALVHKMACADYVWFTDAYILGCGEPYRCRGLWIVL